jgi:hypothetical protein
MVRSDKDNHSESEEGEIGEESMAMWVTVHVIKRIELD